MLKPLHSCLIDFREGKYDPHYPILKAIKRVCNLLTK